VVDKENEITCNALNGKPPARLQWIRGKTGSDVKDHAKSILRWLFTY